MFRLAPDGDPYKFAEMLYQLVVGADNGTHLPLYMPLGKDALEQWQGKLKRMNKTLTDVAPWSADLNKDERTAKARL